LLKVSSFDPSIEGHLVENCAVQNTRFFAEKNLYNLYYWRDGQKEVDIVIDLKNKVIPIEVKYRNEIENDDLKGLNAFMDKFNSP